MTDTVPSSPYQGVSEQAAPKYESDKVDGPKKGGYSMSPKESETASERKQDADSLV